MTHIYESNKHWLDYSQKRYYAYFTTYPDKSRSKKTDNLIQVNYYLHRKLFGNNNITANQYRRKLCIEMDEFFKRIQMSWDNPISILGIQDEGLITVTYNLLSSLNWIPLTENISSLYMYLPLLANYYENITLNQKKEWSKLQPYVLQSILKWYQYKHISTISDLLLHLDSLTTFDDLFKDPFFELIQVCTYASLQRI